MIAGLITLVAKVIPDVITQPALVPSHRFASWILGWIDKILNVLGLQKDKTIEEIIYTAIVVVVAIFIGIIIQKAALFIVKKVMSLRHAEASQDVLGMRMLKKCSHVVAPVVFLCLIPFAFTSDHNALNWLLRIGGVVALVYFGIAVCSILEYAWMRFDRRENTKNHPLKGVLNICRGAVWIIVTIVSVGILIDKSPMSLLAGLGAFAAALMLIFKDSILGFVAGIQLSQNDMLRVGDWIVVPSTIANGIVIDVTLSVVKVQNWDNTIVMLPPYTLVSTSFQNWRGMSDSGFRLISRSVYIDTSSVVPADDALLDRIAAKFPKMKEFIDARRAAVAKGDTNIYHESTAPNGTIATNLGLFRAYLCTYLLAHPKVAHDQTIIVQVNPEESYGVNLNLYFYSNVTSWVPYEAITSEIMEHVHAMAPLFGLTVYNAPDRNSFRVEMNAPEAPAAAQVSAPSPAAPQK